MESLQYDIHMTGEHVIVSRGSRSLWCSRKSGSLKPGSVVTPENLESARYLGKCTGLIGKIQFFAGTEWKLLLISGASSVGVLPSCGQVYCVEKIIIIPLTTDPSPEIYGLEAELSPSTSSRRGSSTKTEGVGGGAGGARQREGKEKDKLERRLMEVLLRMFNDSRSFYFSADGDITHTQQRKVDRSTHDAGSDLPLWERVDERYFWNKWMLQDLLDVTCQRALVEPWILPLIQGYVEIRTLVVHSKNPPNVLKTARQPSVASRGSHGNSEAGEEVDTMTEKSVPKSTSEGLLTVDVDRSDTSYRSDASGYESDSSSSSSSSGSEEVEDKEEKERYGAGDRDRDDGWPHTLQTELQDSEPLSIDIHIQEPERGSSSESCELPQQALRDGPLRPDTTDHERGKRRERKPLLERLRLVRRSNSPDRSREASEDRGTQRTTTKRRRWKVRGRTSGESEDRLGDEGRGEDGELGVSGEHGEGSVVEGTAGENDGQEDGGNLHEEEVDKDDYTFTLALISRRSHHRAGTRYRRRGVDSLGNVANYVETEMILQAGSHHVSYVLVRGSVPIFWTQPGTKYRPPPIIERDEGETQEAFKRHFDRQISLFNHVAITNLINQSGREAVLGEAFEKHVLTLDSPHITYISFDFHRHFKVNPNGAMKRLITATQELQKKFRFCWIDTDVASGPLCRQDGVLRVNCMDCLDRTNVVQTAFCKEVLQSALQKLGIIPFDEHLSGPMLTTYKIMWANNGDCISRQYTGTAAMKGDLTRYGERKFSGMMKDGYNSAHRYYQNLFRDSYRQVLIDLMQGIPHSEAFSSLPPSLRGKGEGEEGEEEEGEEALWSLDREQVIAEMVQLCREELFPTKTHTVIGWALVEAPGYSFVASSRKEEDCVLLQCREKNQLCMASYNAEDDQVNCFIRIPMEKVEKIVIGPLGTILRSSQKRLHLRLYYTLMDSRQCYFTLRTVNFTSIEDDREILLSIASTLAHICSTILVQEQKLTKKKSPAHQGVIYLVAPKDLNDEWTSIREEGISPRPTHTTELQLHPAADDGAPVEECDLDNDEDEDDEKELSLSVPTSPTLAHRPPPQLHRHGRVQRLRSQSFDDILSSMNNEQDLPLSPSATGRTPAIAVSGQNTLFEVPHLLESGSESDTETVPKLQGLGVAYDHSLLVSSQPELTESSVRHKGVGKLHQLKGKLFQKMRQVQGPKVQSLQLPLETHYHSDLATSGSGSDTGGQLDTGQPDTAAETNSHHQLSHVTHRLMAVGQRFRNSPGLLLKMGVAGRGQNRTAIHHAPPSSDSELAGGMDGNGESKTEERHKSQTNFIRL